MGLQRCDGLLGRERDVDVLDAVVVDLHRELRALDAERVKELALRPVRRDDRDGLGHPAEDDSRSLPLERHRDDAGVELEPDLRQLERPREHEGGAEDGVAGKGELALRREDPDGGVAFAPAGIDEDGFGEVQLARERLERVLWNLRRVGEDGELVSRERPLCEDVHHDEPVNGHGGSKPPKPSTSRPVVD